jgi:hypothetical protein
MLTATSFGQAVVTVSLCILLVAIELVVVALIAAPRWVARKLVSLLGTVAHRAQQVLRPASTRRKPGRPSRERA